MARVVNKTKGFSSISRDCVFDSEISDRARFIYVYMACKPEGWEFFQDKMAEELGIKKDTLRKYLDELIIRGWLTELEQENEGRFGSLEYVIEINRKDNNIPIRKKTDTEKTRIGKNHNHINIDNISSKQCLSDIKEIEKKKDNKLSPKNKRFIKPTIKQIDEYIKEKDMHFEAERFFDYYESKGWMVGKSPMKDWKAACRTWESQRKHEFKEEQTEESGIVYPEGMTGKQWMDITAWLQNYCRHIAGYITPEMLTEMKALAGDSKTLSDILKELGEASEHNRNLDIMEEFKKRIKERQA